jgi:hypothetical protein
MTRVSVLAIAIGNTLLFSRNDQQGTSNDPQHNNA